MASRTSLERDSIRSPEGGRSIAWSWRARDSPEGPSYVVDPRGDKVRSAHFQLDKLCSRTIRYQRRSTRSGLVIRHGPHRRGRVVRRPDLRIVAVHAQPVHHPHRSLAGDDETMILALEETSTPLVVGTTIRIGIGESGTSPPPDLGTRCGPPDLPRLLVGPEESESIPHGTFDPGRRSLCGGGNGWCGFEGGDAGCDDRRWRWEVIHYRLLVLTWILCGPFAGACVEEEDLMEAKW